jgi:uncharacterized membrane protein required for colicin V production
MNASVPAVALNWYDFVVLVALLFGIWSGLRTGLVGELIRLVGLVAMAALALWLYQPVGHWLHGKSGMAEELANLAAFLTLATAVYAVSVGVRAWLHRRMKKGIRTAFIENTGGAALGVVRMAVVMGCVCVTLTLMRSPFWHKHVARESQFGSFVVGKFPAVKAMAEKEFPEQFFFFRDVNRPEEPGIESGTKTN